MSFDSAIVVITILGLLYVLVRDIASPTVAFLGALAIVLSSGIISPEEGLSGFSSPVLFIIATLFVIAKGLQNTINTGKLVDYVLGNSSHVPIIIARLTGPIALLSGFMANTPIVATLIQPINTWSKTNNVSVSKLLIPLSYAAILGGVLTLTGTSTNLVVSGLLVEAGQAPLGYFEITKLGLPVAIVGLLSLVLFAPKLLPTRKVATKKDNVRSSITEYQATKTLAGKTVSQANLRNLQKLYLAAIIRKDGDIITPVSPKTIIRENDTLQFVGDIKDVALSETVHGLVRKADKHTKELGIKSGNLYEVVLGHDSEAINKTLKSMHFRGYYQAAALAINRSGEQIIGKLGEVKMKVGDTLLLAADDYFEERWAGERDFLIINKMENNKKINRPNLYRLTAVLMGVGGLALIAGADLLTALLVAALLLVATKVVSLSEARRAIDFDLLILIAASISFAKAVINSGLSDNIANGLMNVFGNYGEVGLLISVVIAALVLTEFVTNTASATLLFPIVFASATALGSDPRIFALVLAVACSISFLSPLGYQTNTMVFGPGGYKFTDFTRVGSVLTLTTATTLILVAASLL